MDYHDYQLQVLFEGLCEQILDYLGTEDGRQCLYKKFPGFEPAVDVKVESYICGHRITKKTDEPDAEIIKICEGWKND